jgi:hypothetical protein
MMNLVRHLFAGAGRACHHAGWDRVLGVAAGEKAIRSAATASGVRACSAASTTPTSARMCSSAAVTSSSISGSPEAADVQSSPLFAHCLLEAALQRVAVRRLSREESQHGVVQRHVIVLLRLVG